MRAAGRPTDRPNLVAGINVQVCWEKFCRYWDVEPRLVPMEGDRYHLGAEEAAALCDENTIGVAAILGSTFDGSYEPVAEIAAALDALERDRGHRRPDPRRRRLGRVRRPVHPARPRVGLPDPAGAVDQRVGSQVRAGLPRRRLGAVARPRRAAEDLVFDVNYLGGHMPTFALNFSRPGSEVVAQYHMFTSLGRRATAPSSSAPPTSRAGSPRRSRRSAPTRSSATASDLPVFAFTLKPEVTNYTVFDVSDRLRERGWLVPAYTFPANREDLSVLRIVVRAGMTHEMGELRCATCAHTAALESLSAPSRRAQTGLGVRALTTGAAPRGHAAAAVRRTARAGTRIERAARIAVRVRLSRLPALLALQRLLEQVADVGLTRNEAALAVESYDQLGRDRTGTGFAGGSIGAR